MEIYRANELNFDCREDIATIFAEGFTQWLGYFSKDPQVIAQAFAHAFQLEYFFVAVSGGRVVGIVACTDCRHLSLKFNKSELLRHLGWFKGTIAERVLPREFAAPFKNPPKNTGSIEFVRVAAQARNSGVASRMLKTVIAQTSYADFIIEEVADTNLAAMALYQKLGFIETKRRPLSVKQAQRIGINAFVSWKLTKDHSTVLVNN
ncbi:GNAT family N-acetyltransferase [Lapidilactobacillus luobeiensis]|uniref:GNAT family N-acetyltransferase n=1 Tax=Lapidilactobacillus luobeiensis TaxID=2950371 RepID=UPI0021C2CA4F|nr:GNAT family N-acetyltransferase [Lapidilactobacillus luobeiensis]